ncbi:hypothetical protein [Mesorhizobium sp. WSM3224]|uniref:hypothetical protein n=1 Tax=Mesorhizobium sp. WSM3224 TaxID=1040986 RepID=UPI0004246D2F|nr:hypothetical protein [Mesorhizobium sp. WSM3224]
MYKLPRLLCVGLYLADKKHTAHHIAEVLSRSETVAIEQRWTALTLDESKADVADTIAVVSHFAPRSMLINEMLRDFDKFDWVMLCDDSVEMAYGFADSLIAVANHADLALVQPALTHDSFIVHPMGVQFPGLLARRTRFVEICPVVCMRADAAKLLLPFPPECQSGWGLDFVWPARIEAADLRMGIIDAAPVAHRVRAPITGYNHEAARAEQDGVIAGEPSLTAGEAFRILEAFS